MKKTFSIAVVVSIIVCMLTGTVIAGAAQKKYNKRYDGKDRFQTSIAIAEQLYGDKKVDNIVMASAYNFPDALAAGTLAVKLNAPIILAGKGNNDTIDSLVYIENHLTPGGTVTIVGGFGAVPKVISNYLTKKGCKVDRLDGKDRFATDAKIVSELNIAKGTPVIIANGYNYPDALGIASLAASKGWPILLTSPNKLPQAVSDFVKSEQPTDIYIVGGEAVVNDKIKDALQSDAPGAKIERFSGNDRFETLSKVLNEFFPKPSKIYIANGFEFADALTGSTLAASSDAPILLINPACKSLPLAVKNYLISLHKDGIDPEVDVLGGTGSVPDYIMDRIYDILGTVTPKSTSTTTPSSSLS